MSSVSHGRSHYRIVFRGESESLAAAFPHLASAFEDGNTVLTGAIVDRAGLQGLLARADSLGFELISVNPIDPENGSAAPPSQPT